MNYLKRAWLSVTRRKGKSLLLFVIIFVLGNVIAGAVSIQQATQNVEQTIKLQMGATATLQADYENLKESQYEEVGTLTKDIVTKVGELPYVKYYDYVLMASFGSETLKPYTPDELSDMQVPQEANYYAFRLRGTQSSKLLPLEEGHISLSSGRTFTDDEVKSGKNVVLISKELAESNQLSVGDTAHFTSFVMNYETNEVAEKIDYPMEVIGIYQTKPKSGEKEENKQSFEAYQDQQLLNQVYLPNKVVETVRLAEAETMAVDIPEDELKASASIGEPLYVLKNPEDLEKFKQEAQAYLPKHYVVKATSDAFDRIAAPVKSMSKLAGYVLVVAVLATVVIITLVVLLFLRDRKHELGIYLSLGEAKRKVVLQTLAEVLMIAMVAVSLSVFSGNLMAKGVSSTLLQHQINNHQDNGGTVFYGIDELNTNTTLDDVVEQYQVSLTPSYIAVMYGIGLGTVLVATIVPMTYIVRLNPKRIMM